MKPYMSTCRAVSDNVSAFTAYTMPVITERCMSGPAFTFAELDLVGRRNGPKTSDEPGRLTNASTFDIRRYVATKQG
jgi:hypothetical protein